MLDNTEEKTADLYKVFRTWDSHNVEARLENQEPKSDPQVSTSLWEEILFQEQLKPPKNGSGFICSFHIPQAKRNST